MNLPIKSITSKELMELDEDIRRKKYLRYTSDMKRILERILTKWSTRVANGEILPKDIRGIWFLRQRAFEFLTPYNTNNNTSYIKSATFIGISSICVE